MPFWWLFACTTVTVINYKSL